MWLDIFSKRIPVRKEVYEKTLARLDHKNAEYCYDKNVPECNDYKIKIRCEFCAVYKCGAKNLKHPPCPIQKHFKSFLYEGCMVVAKNILRLNHMNTCIVDFYPSFVCWATEDDKEAREILSYLRNKLIQAAEAGKKRR